MLYDAINYELVLFKYNDLKCLYDTQPEYS